MEATRFAAEVSRLQAELTPTPPWSWVARGLAAALAGFESGGLTDPILLCDLQRQCQGGKAWQAAAKDDVRAAMEERRVEWGRPLEVEVRSIEASRQLLWLTAPGAADEAPALPLTTLTLTLTLTLILTLALASTLALAPTLTQP